MALRRGFAAEANRIALRVRECLGISPIDRFDPIAACAHFDIELLKMSELDCDSSAFQGFGQSHFSAVTVPCGPRTAIVHNDSHHPNRQRSNICHELAHCFLGHKMAPPLNDKGARIHDSGIEAEANYLGGALLIPNEAAHHAVANGIAHMAHVVFGVSEQMVQYRLRISGAHVVHRRRLARDGLSVAGDGSGIEPIQCFD